MLTNRHKRIKTTGGAAKARVWSGVVPGARGTVAAATMAGPCLSSSAAAYLFGGEFGLRGANSINGPRRADRYNLI